MAKISTSPCHKGNNPNPPQKNKQVSKTKLRNVARRTLFGMLDKNDRPQKTCTCGNGDGGNVMTVGTNQHGRRVALGVITCKSVWTCPVCADSITARRRDEVRDVLNGYQYQEQGTVYMLALTLPHNREQRLLEVAGALKQSWNKFVQSGVYPKIKKEINIQGYIKTMEMTVNTGAGWHPHYHILFFVKNELTEEQRLTVEQRLFERWALLVAKQDMGECNRPIFQFTKALTPEQAGDYALKGNLSSELTGWHKKVAKGGGYTPFMLLETIRTSNNMKMVSWAKRLYREYAEYVKGSRYTTYSKSLKKKYGVRDDNDEELIDQEVVAEIKPEIHLKMDDYTTLIKKGVWEDFLDAVETGDFEEFLSRYGITRLQFSTYDKIPPKTDYRITWEEHLKQQVLQVYYDKTTKELNKKYEYEYLMKWAKQEQNRIA